MIPDEILNPVIEDIAGEEVIPLVQLIKGKSNVSEFKMAEKLDITINQVRNMIYRLSAHNLVESTRKKDKKKGWYVYSWTLNMLKLRDLTVNRKRDTIGKLKFRLNKEENEDFFKCPDKHIRASLSTAMEYEFKCPECGVNLQKEDNKKVVDKIKKVIKKLESEIELLLSLKIKAPPEKKAPPQKKPAKKKKLVKKKPIKKKPAKKKIKKKKQKKKPTKKTKKVQKKKPKRKFIKKIKKRFTKPKKKAKRKRR